MSIYVFVEITVKPEFSVAYVERLANAFKTTRAFEGCEEIHAYRDHATANRFVVAERWATREHYDAYIAWRTDTGIFEQLKTIAETPLVTRICDPVAEG